MAAPPISILSASSSVPCNIPSGIYLGPSVLHSSNDVAAHFWSDCLSFTMAATATIAISTVSLISDWMLLRLLRSLHVPGYSNLSSSDSSSDLGLHLHPDPTSVLDIILVVSSVIYGLYFLWFIYMFSIQRSMLKDRWDGLPTKRHFLVKFGGEIFTFLLTVSQDIPVSTLLFIIQSAAGCQLVLITENTIFLVATCSTLFSVIWKVGQVIWNSGCFGFRYEYLTSKGLVALRWTTVLALGVTFALATCNIVLISGWKSSTISARQLSNSFMDKVGVDRWWRQDYVMLVAGQSDESLNDNLNSNTNSSTPPVIDTKVQVASLRLILKPDEPELFSISVIPCVGQNYDFTPFLESGHLGMKYDSCTIYFNFHAVADSMTIKYNFRYMLQKDNSCWSGNLQRFKLLSQDLFSTSSDDKSPDTKSNVDVPDSSDNRNNEAFTATPANNRLGTSYASQSLEPHSGSKVPRSRSVDSSSFHGVILDSFTWPSNSFSCQYALLRDLSLLENHNLCR